MNSFMLSELTKLKESVDKIKDIITNEVKQIADDILANAESMSNEYTEEENKIVDDIEQTIIDIQKEIDRIYPYVDDWEEIKDI